MREPIIASAVLLAASISLVPGSVGAGTTVDPDTLVPPPPDATCEQNGRYIICHIGFVEQHEDDLVDLGLPCGPVYETIDDVRVGIRWYDAEGRLVKRLVNRDMEGSWSLSPGGAGPVVSLSGHGGWGEVYPTPGDLSSARGHSHGTEQGTAPGYGVIWHIAGRAHEEQFHGTFLTPDDPSIASTLCAALGAGATQ